MRFRLIVFIVAGLVGSAFSAAAIELKDITYTTENAGKVVFSHKTHLNKKKKKSAGFACQACHGKEATKGHVTMAQMEKGKSCGACHNGKLAFPLAKCTRCHKVRDIAMAVKETGPVAFSHARHLKTMQCGSCHDKIFKTGRNKRVSMAQMEKGASCGACHNGKKAFALAECAQCHPVKDRLYKLEAGNVIFSHTVHTGMYKCGECHTGIYLPGKGNKVASMGDMEKGESCGACHDSKVAFTVKENCDKCHK